MNIKQEACRKADELKHQSLTLIRCLSVDMAFRECKSNKNIDKYIDLDKDSHFALFGIISPALQTKFYVTLFNIFDKSGDISFSLQKITSYFNKNRKNIFEEYEKYDDFMKTSKQKIKLFKELYNDKIHGIRNDCLIHKKFARYDKDLDVHFNKVKLSELQDLIFFLFGFADGLLTLLRSEEVEPDILSVGKNWYEYLQKGVHLFDEHLGVGMPYIEKHIKETKNCWWEKLLYE